MNLPTREELELMAEAWSDDSAINFMGILDLDIPDPMFLIALLALLSSLNSTMSELPLETALQFFQHNSLGISYSCAYRLNELIGAEGYENLVKTFFTGNPLVSGKEHVC